MSLQMSPVQSTKDHVADIRSIDLSVIDGRRLQRSKFAGRFAEDGITLSLVHLDVALAVKADCEEAADRVPCFRSPPNASHGVWAGRRVVGSRKIRRPRHSAPFRRACGNGSCA